MMPSLLQIHQMEPAPYDADVVFIHGLTGDPRATWQWNETSSPAFFTPIDNTPVFWPDLLVTELPSIGVWSIGYDAAASEWLGTSMPLIDRGTSILHLLEGHDLLRRPTIFIAHSFGGLIVKQMIRAAAESSMGSQFYGLHKNIAGVVFFGTPHTGSSLPSYMDALRKILRPTAMIKDLELHHPYLRDLDDWFRDHFSDLQLRVLSYAETKKTRGVTVVDPSSSNPHIAGARPIPCDVDHIALCKISDPYDIRFKQTVKLIRGCLDRPIAVGPSSTQSGLTIDIGVEREAPNDGRNAEDYPTDRQLKYSITEELTSTGERRFSIRPEMEYLQRLADSRLIEGIKYFHNPFLCHFPNLDIAIVNNTTETIAITGAVFDVNSSVPVAEPIIVLKDNNARMQLRIINEGWGQACDAVLKCNIVPTGAAIQPNPPIDHISVDGPYAHEFPIGDFATETILDLQDTFISLGVDVARIREVGYRSQHQYYDHALANGLDRRLWQHFGRFPNLETDDAWKAFPDGFAVIVGILKYDYFDQHTGDRTSKSLPIRLRLFLFNSSLDLPMPPSYQYNVSLEADRTSYCVECPIYLSIRSGEADRIQVRVACDRSAIHDFVIKWRLSGGRQTVSPRISLEHFVSRTWSRERIEAQNAGTNGDKEPPSANPFAGMHCMDASFLQMMLMQQLYSQKRQEEGEAALRPDSVPPPV